MVANMKKAGESNGQCSLCSLCSLPQFSLHETFLLQVGTFLVRAWWGFGGPPIPIPFGGTGRRPDAGDRSTDLGRHRSILAHRLRR